MKNASALDAQALDAELTSMVKPKPAEASGSASGSPTKRNAEEEGESSEGRRCAWASHERRGLCLVYIRTDRSEMFFICFVSATI